MHLQSYTIVIIESMSEVDHGAAYSTSFRKRLIRQSKTSPEEIDNNTFFSNPGTVVRIF